MAAGRIELLGRLRQWILGGRKNEDCKIIALVHQDGDSHLKPIETWEVAENADIDALCSAIMDMAESDAAGSDERQTYYALAYFGDARPGTNAYGGRQRINIEGVPQFGEGLDGSIGSSDKMDTPKQWVSNMGKMMLEHHRLTAPWVNEMMRNYQRQNDTLQRRCTELENKLSANLIIQERLISRQHERQLALRKVIYWERKKEELGAIVIPMIPTIISALAGKQLTQGNSNGAQNGKKVDYAEIFQRFVLKIAPQEQKLQKLQKALKLPQMVPAAGLIDAIKNGQPVNKTVLIEFLKPVDEEQMKTFEALLDEEEYELFVNVHQAVYMEWLEMQKKTEEAMREAEAAMNGDGMPAEKPPIRDDEALRDDFESQPV